MTAIQNSNSSTSYGFDAAGRAVSSTQVTAGFSFTYGYNLANALTNMTFLSQRALQLSYDGLNRVYSISGNLPQQTVKSYVAQVQYAPQNAFSVVQLGNNLYRNFQ